MRVHNITGHASTPGTSRAMRVARRTIRPGKFVEIPDNEIGSKIRLFHGSALWFGDQLPDHLRRPLPSEMDAEVPAMTVVEARTYLDTLSDADLRKAAAAIIPPLLVAPGMARAILVARLARGLFQESRVVDPQLFFWLRRWVKTGNTYVEKE